MRFHKGYQLLNLHSISYAFRIYLYTQYVVIFTSELFARLISALPQTNGNTFELHRCINSKKMSKMIFLIFNIIPHRNCACHNKRFYYKLHIIVAQLYNSHTKLRQHYIKLICKISMNNV